MKFKFTAIISIIILSLTVFMSCGKDPVQTDLLNYVNSLKKVSYLEREAITSYQSVTGLNYKNDNEVIAMLKLKVIPGYSKFIEKLSKIDVKTEEVMNLNKLYITSAKKQMEAFNIIEDGMLKQDENITQGANVKLSEAREGMETFNKRLKLLAKEHKVEIK